jgi:acetate kinase
MTKVCIALNAGSSSLKFQIFEADAADERSVVFRGLFERLGGAAHFVVKGEDGRQLDESSWQESDSFGHEKALLHLVAWLQAHKGGRELAAVGHRIVHGGAFYDGPVTVDDRVIANLESLAPLAPLHQPYNLEPVRIVRRRLPHIPQIACFDTSFHATQPEVATTFALPREIRERGVRRYGFHGLSYEYIASVLQEHDPALARGRVVVAHLGSGASLCALDHGRSVATTMGLSALDGIPMGTRCGSIDPGAVFYMIRELGMSADAAEKTLYTKSGLLGVSGLSNDMRTLREAAAKNPDARRAIDLFTYRIRREIGSLAAALGGIDGLVFTAGIGENDAATRAEVINGLAWTGLELDADANARGGPRISRGSGPSAWVIPTNEELVIARQMRRVIAEKLQPAAAARASSDCKEMTP